MLNKERMPHIEAALEAQTEVCPYCGGKAEHVEDVKTGDWTCEQERWVCAKDRLHFFIVQYDVEREFTGIREDDDDKTPIQCEEPTPGHTLDERQRATLLAALSYWQNELDSGDFETNGPHFAKVTPLSSKEVEALYAQLDGKQLTAY